MIEAKPLRTGAIRVAAVLTAIAMISACDPVSQTPKAEAPEPGVMEATRNGPADAAPGTCWGKTISPAVVERVSQKILVKPAKTNSDGSIASLPVYRTEEKQVIVTPRKDNWFGTPCPDVLTPEFVSSLQRALQVRGGYAGPITGTLGPATRAAILRFQRQQGLESAVLSIKAARALGLIAVERDPAE